MLMFWLGRLQAVFTALCRKNYGCNHFIIGRDHTGVGKFYSNDASTKVFDELGIDIKIIKYDTSSFCIECGMINFNCKHSISEKREISGSKVRGYLKSNKTIPWYMMRSEISEILKNLYLKKPEYVFEKYIEF